jgi:SAM-dependent methyltransferase
MEYLDKSKEFWVSASTFPGDKEKVYPDHGVVQEFDKHHGKQVYEYGFGGGSDVMSYLRRGNYVTATDIVPENIKVATERIYKAGFDDSQFSLILLEDSYPIPLPDNHLDIASSHGVLHHILDPKPVIEEIHRILKPDGLFYCMLYTEVMEDYFNEMGMISGFMQRHGIDYNEAFGYCTDGVGTPYSRSYTPEQAIELICPIGFVLEDYTYWLNDHFNTFKFSKTVI